MRTKLFLTSCITMGFVAPAMAENFPSNGLMQENKTYDNAATSTNMDGVYEGTVNATAEYENILYNIVAGNYLPGGSEETNGSQCTPGNFCTGLTNATYSESDQGLTSCSTLGDGSYTLSPAGATNGNMCYKTCSASCTNPSAPAHSTNVSYGHETTSGTQYYGSQCDAVTPTCSISFDCVNGYHKRPDLTVAQGVALMKQMAQAQGQDITGVPDSYFAEQLEYAFANWGMVWSSLSVVEQGMVTQAIDTVQGHNSSANGTIQDMEVYQIFDNMFSKYGIDINEINGEGTLFQQPLVQLLVSIFTNEIVYSKNLNGDEFCKTGSGEISCDTLSRQYPEIAQFRQNAQNGDWFSSIPTENISASGTSRCINSGSWPCEISYSTVNGSPVNTDYTTEWGDIVDGWNFKHSSETGDGKTCEEACAVDTASNSLYYIFDLYLSKNIENYNMTGYPERFGPLFEGKTVSGFVGNSGYIDYMCDANTITINWNDVDPEYAGQNGEDTAKYDGDIRTPVKAQHKPGKTFTGWRFVAPTPVQSGN